MINLGAVIGGIIGAIIIALAFFVFLLWKCRKRQALLQKPFEVKHRVGAPDFRVSPYQKAMISGPNDSLPSIEQRIGLLAAPVTPDLVTQNSEDSSLLQANLEKASQRLSSENDGNDRAEIIPAEHRPAQSALEIAEPPEHNETLHQLDLITYRHQDSGWRPGELRDDRNILVGGREVIELPPNYSEAS